MAVRDEVEARLRPVSSRQNALVKDLRKSFSQSGLTQEGLVAIEGVRILEEAIRSGLKFQAVFFSESGRIHAERLLPQISSHTEALLLPDAVFSRAVDTETPQGVAALVRPKTFRLEEVLQGTDENLLIVGLAGVQDPGNVGTVIRSAEAFFARAVLLGEKTASHFNSKVVRASAGSVFREPVLHLPLLEAAITLKERKVRVIATSSHKGKPAAEIDLSGPLALLIGNEGAGLPASVVGLADELVSISHSPRVESLNAGIAASILLYEAARQRKTVFGTS
ncbi:MAG TPA: RNA methyltransferase [Candidatus Angelobacter sp.]